MSQNKVSIIIPIYNQEEKLINKCILSLINQTYGNIEILMINDGSNENNKKLYDSISRKDSRIKLFHKKNTGVSDSRNFGIKKATGEYVTFVDSDDWIENDAIEKMVEQLEKNSVDVLRTTYYIVKNNQNILREYNIDTGLYDKKKIREVLIPALINGIENNFVCLLLIKKDLLLNNYFDKEIGMLEDECFFIKLLLDIEKIYLLDIPTYYYYQNILSKTKSSIYFENNINDVIKANYKLQELLRKNDLNDLVIDLNKIHSLIILNYLNLIYKTKNNMLNFLKSITREIDNNKLLVNLDKFKISLYLKFQLYLIKKNYYRTLLLFFKVKNKIKK